MKGSAATAVVVIIVLVIAAIIILPRLGINFAFPFAFPSGGNVPVTTVKYNNDVITIDGFSISDRSPLSGGSVTMIFSVTNNGDKDFDNSDAKAPNNLKVSFTDLPNIEKNLPNDPIKLQCPEDSMKSTDGLSCTINKLESLDSKKIQAELKVKSGITDEIQMSAIKYSVSYNMKGSLEAKIPIVEDSLFLPKDSNFQVGNPTYGPIQVSVKPPVGRERKVGGQTVVDNFAYKDSPFNLELSVKDVGGWSSKQEVKMHGDNLKINLDSLEYVFCDKMVIIENDKSKLILVSAPEQKVPFEIACNVKSKSSSENYLIGTVSINYNYNYKLLGSETLAIKPFKGVQTVDLSTATSDITFDPAQPKIGDKVTVTAKIYNNGNFPVSNVKVKFQKGSVTLDTKTINSIQAGGSTSVSTTFTADKGSQTITVIVDPDKAIAESNENNNIASSDVIGLVAV